MGKIKVRDINGNYIEVDTNTGKSTNLVPEAGTIRTNSTQIGDNKTVEGRNKIARGQVQSYNNRQLKVHNYADTTRRNIQNRQKHYVDSKTSEPIVKQADYIPALEAPMELTHPEFDLLMTGRQIATSTGNKLSTYSNDESSSSYHPPLSDEIIDADFKAAKKFHLDRINSKNWERRAAKAGFSKEETQQLRQQLTQNLQELKIIEKWNNPEIRINGRMHGVYRILPSKFAQNIPEKSGIIINRLRPRNEMYATLIHELGHGMTYQISPGSKTVIQKSVQKQFPLITRMVEYNNSLLGAPSNKGRYFSKPFSDKYFQYAIDPNELNSRGYQTINDAIKQGTIMNQQGIPYNENKFYKNVFNTGSIGTKIFLELVGPNKANKFIARALGISAPIGFGLNSKK